MSHIKSIHELTAQDLRRHPIWEFATGSECEHDETAVSPVITQAVPVEEDFAVYHAACVVTTALGTALTGFMSLCAGELHDPAPVVVGEAGGYFPLDCPPTRKEKAAFESLLGAPYPALFPVRWRLVPCVGGEAMPRSGIYSVAGYPWPGQGP